MAALAYLQPSRLPSSDEGPLWSSYRNDVVATEATSPRDAVLIAWSPQEVKIAWHLAYSLGLDGDDVRGAGHSVREGDRLAVLPVLTRQLDNDVTRPARTIPRSRLVDLANLST